MKANTHGIVVLTLHQRFTSDIVLPGHLWRVEREVVHSSRGEVSPSF